MPIDLWPYQPELSNTLFHIKIPAAFNQFILNIWRGIFCISRSILKMVSKSLSPPLTLNLTTFQWNILTPTQFQGVYNGHNSFSSFLNVFLCVESNTLFIGTPLPLYSSRNLVSNIWHFLCDLVWVFWCFLNVFTAVSHVWYGFL